MGKFDAVRFNGFARQGLGDMLLSDFWNYDIFNESDMHSSAYYYIRNYFRKHGRDSVYVRCEPQLAKMRPDIVIYEKGSPIYILEFKFFSKPDYINEDAINNDLDKLADCVDAYESVRWGFFHMIYDADELFTLSDSRLRRKGFPKVSVTSINARRKEGTERRRNGYDTWRAEFDNLHALHREHA